MSIQTQIKDEIKKAMIAKDQVRLLTFRGLSAAFTNELVAKGQKPQEEIKDEDALAVIKRMVKDLNFDLEVAAMPTVREPDGMAMSSRNAYLSAAQRRSATALYQALAAGRALIRAGERRSRVVIREMRRLIIAQPQARVDYAAIADAATLQPRARLRGRMVLLLAVRVGRTRLIDNLLVEVS